MLPWSTLLGVLEDVREQLVFQGEHFHSLKRVLTGLPRELSPSALEDSLTALLHMWAESCASSLLPLRAKSWEDSQGFLSHSHSPPLPQPSLRSGRIPSRQVEVVDTLSCP